MVDKVKETIEPGAYKAKILYYIDKGMQSYTWQGEEKWSYRVNITFEVDSKMQDGRPFVVSHDFVFNNKHNVKTQSKNDLPTFIEKITGELMDSPRDINEFDYKSLLGKSLWLKIDRKTSKSGKPYNFITSWKATDPDSPYDFESENDYIFFVFSDPKVDEYKKINSWMRGQLRESPNWKKISPEYIREDMELFDQESTQSGKAVSDSANTKKVANPEKNAFNEEDPFSEELDDEIPF